MSHPNSNTYRQNNENILLINILNTMYNDNLTQINNLQDSNNQIRNLLVQILTSGTAHRMSANTAPTGASSSQQNNHHYSRSRGNSLSERRPRENSITNEERRTPRTNQQNTYPRRFSFFDTPLFNYIGEYEVPVSLLSQNTQRRNVTDPSINVNIAQLLQSFLQPIEVRPTPAQIEVATRRVRYCDIVSPQNTSCPISMEEFNDSDTVTIVRHCSHIFNTEQINNWFNSNCRCPVCRYDIREYNANVTTEFYPAQPAVDISFNSTEGRERIQEPGATLYDNLRSDIINTYNRRRNQEQESSDNYPEIEGHINQYINQALGLDISGNMIYNNTLNFLASNILHR